MAGEAVAVEKRTDEPFVDVRFLGREFLTWLAYHAEAGDGRFEGEGGGFTIGFGGKVTLRTPAGLVTDMAIKGPSPVGSADLRYALAGGLAVKEAELWLEHQERTFRFALSAEGFDLKRVKLPALLTEEEDDRVAERIALLDELDQAVRQAFDHFMRLRAGPSWRAETVPAIRAWLDEGT